ncbi:MAG: anti-sigma F factor [Clostridiales bacterium]|nr:anti-sigma F factor [Clostridiales bacterium]
MNFKNEMILKFKAKSVNESFARSAVAAFLLPLDPTLEELNDIKTAVSEAVTNCIVHAYEKGEEDIELACSIDGDTVHITVSDTGVGISDIEKARQPFFTTKPEDERSGMGFTLMETFMDNLEVLPNQPLGVIVKMSKKIGNKGG